MDTLTFVIGIISAAVISGILVVLFGDQIIRKKLPAAAPDPLAEPQAQAKDREETDILTRELRRTEDKYSKDIEKLKEECELFKKDSFSARLEVQNLSKELVAQQSAYNILSHEYQALKAQLTATEDMKRQDHDGDEVEINALKKTKEDIGLKLHKSVEEYDGLKSKFETFKEESGQLYKALEKKCEDLGFHKVAFEKLSEEHELMRRYVDDLQELHKGDQTAVEELKKKLDSTTEALRAEEQVQEDTVKLEALLEKQLAVQKKRAADFLELEKENKALKEQLKTFQQERQNES